MPRSPTTPRTSSDKAPERMGGVGASLPVELERARKAAEASRTIVLVEGVSDRRAIEALARRRLRNLDSEGVTVVPMAGATNARRFLGLLGPNGYDVRLTGLCDQGEIGLFSQAMREAGLGSQPTAADMERVGFYVCVRDLEDELIRALGVDRVEAIIEDQGALRSFRSFQNQPAQREKLLERQLWRWMGNRKIRYARLLVEALDLERVPRPLDELLTGL